MGKGRNHDCSATMLAWELPGGLPAGVEPPEQTVPGVRAAAAELARRLQDGEQLAVFADYDPDGTCSAALLRRALGPHADQVLWGYASPTQGTGLSEAFVRQAAERGCSTLITVDLGSGQPEPLALAQRLGLRTCVTDHHHPHPEVAPDHHLNPQMHGAGSQASGANVAFKLGLELQRELWGEPQSAYLQYGSWLAGFAARADLMDLGTPENAALDRLTVELPAPPGVQAAARALGLSSLARSNQGRVAALLNLPKRTPLAQAAWSAAILAAAEPAEAEPYLQQLLEVRARCSAVGREYLGRAWAGHEAQVGGHVACAVIRTDDSHLFSGYAGIVALNYARTCGSPAAIFIPQDAAGQRFKWSVRTGAAELDEHGALGAAERIRALGTPPGASPAGGHPQALGGVCTAEQIPQIQQLLNQWGAEAGLPPVRPSEREPA